MGCYRLKPRRNSILRIKVVRERDQQQREPPQVAVLLLVGVPNRGRSLGNRLPFSLRSTGECGRGAFSLSWIRDVFVFVPLLCSVTLTQGVLSKPLLADVIGRGVGTFRICLVGTDRKAASLIMLLSVPMVGEHYFPCLDLRCFWVTETSYPLTMSLPDHAPCLRSFSGSFASKHGQ